MTVTIKNIWYNPANAAFEGRIDIEKDGVAFRYPCAVEGPMTMSPAEVRDRMKRHAQRMSDSPANDHLNIKATLG